MCIWSPITIITEVFEHLLCARHCAKCFTITYKTKG